MRLPYPFDQAVDVMADAQGSVKLTDGQGKPIVRVPLATAFELHSPAVDGVGTSGYAQEYSPGSGDGIGDYGSGTLSGFGYGSGDDYGVGHSDGSGLGIVK